MHSKHSQVQPKCSENVVKGWYALLVISVFPWSLRSDWFAYVSKIMPGHVVLDVVWLAGIDSLIWLSYDFFHLVIDERLGLAQEVNLVMVHFVMIWHV